MVQESLAAGADLVCFSGDKLLGGPQAGLIVGKAEVIGRLRRHPLTRALRPDKVTLAGLQATLVHYVRGEAATAIPIWRMIASPIQELERRAEAILQRIEEPLIVAVLETRATIGGGSLPEETLPSRALALTSADEPAQQLAGRLRAHEPPIIGRILDGRVLLDLRTVREEEDQELAAALMTL
jgi:L-seryl-tRNA(Ser) seleniumtransferase